MSGFHQQLMQQELDGAKEAAASYEKQVKRLLAENATLRDGTGLAGHPKRQFTNQLPSTMSP